MTSNLKESNIQYIIKNSRDFEKVRWFVNSNNLDMVYYNPNSDAGGQLVIIKYSFDTIKKAAKEHFYAEDFFSYLNDFSIKILIDIDSKNFRESAQDFVREYYFAESESLDTENLDTMKKLLKLAGVKYRLMYEHSGNGIAVSIRFKKSKANIEK